LVQLLLALLELQVVFAATSATSFSIGDVLEVVTPAVVDTTLADLSITLAGVL